MKNFFLGILVRNSLKDDHDFENLYSFIENYQIVSDFFKQERLKEVNARMRNHIFFRYKFTPLAVAIVAIAYPFYESSAQSCSSQVAS